jgi:hypothetical protein
METDKKLMEIGRDWWRLVEIDEELMEGRD